MPKLRVHNLAMSLDGYAAGPNQSLGNPLGERGSELHEFAFQTKKFGGPGASEVDERFVAAREHNVGGPATIRQYVLAGLVDELQVAIVPVLFGAGERLLEPISEAVHGFEAAEVVSSPESKVTHVRLVRR